jgi:hypothetical protein
MQNEPAPWEYWQVRFAEKGICRWDEFEDMPADDVHRVIAVWDGMARAEASQAKKGGGKGQE